MKTYILAAVLAALPLAAQAASTEDMLTYFALRAFLAQGNPDCLRPINQLTLLELDTCKALLEQARGFARPLADAVDKNTPPDAARR
jgi:hypothetical protein